MPVTDEARREADKDAVAAACRAFSSLRMVVPADEEEVPRYVLQRMYALLVDVQGSVEVLLSTYDAAQSVLRNLEGVGSREITARELYEELEPQERFITAFKSVFFFIRHTKTPWQGFCSSCLRVRGLAL